MTQTQYSRCFSLITIKCISAPPPASWWSRLPAKSSRRESIFLSPSHHIRPVIESTCYMNPITPGSHVPPTRTKPRVERLSTAWTQRCFQLLSWCTHTAKTHTEEDTKDGPEHLANTRWEQVTHIRQAGRQAGRRPACRGPTGRGKTSTSIRLLQGCQLPHVVAVWRDHAREPRLSFVSSWAGGGVKCAGSALHQQMKCDVHSAATHIQTGFSLHADVCGLVTGQTLASPRGLVWHADTSLFLCQHTPNYGQSGLSELNFKFVAVTFPREHLLSCLLPLAVLNPSPGCSASRCDIKLRKWKR